MNLITVARCGDWQEAQLLKLRLEAAGIPVLLPDEMNMYDGLLVFMGGIRVQVPDEHAEAAKALLRSPPESEAE